ncbi:MAG: hypothetical protein RMJ55_16855 [Roseiflexaceae bacterium]|nr:hypothetical protein [Roseiflexaceae bacterium]
MNIKHLVLLTALTLALAGCSIIGAAPTPTPVPPTPTPRPTDTPQPTPTPRPTDTPQPTPTTAAPTQPPASASADVIRSGLLSATKADTYRIEFSIKVRGPVGDEILAGAMPSPSPDGMVEFLSMKAEAAGENARVETGGVVPALLLSGDPQKSIQWIYVNGKTYVRGPAPFLGATEDAWYQFPAEWESPEASNPTEQITVSLQQSGSVDVSRFTLRGSETLDGQRCTVFGSDKEDAIRFLSSFSQQLNISLLEEDEVKQAEIRVFICEDGRMHKMTIDLSGVAQGQTEPNVVSMLLRLYDFNSNIQIVAPANARPLTPPSFGLPTPTP